MKIYTKVGDEGSTSLVDGSKVSKGDLRLSTYGNTDELNSQVGLLVCELRVPSQSMTLDIEIAQLTKIQHQLFNLGSQLACSDESMSSQLPNINQKHIDVLELEIDRMSAPLPPLKNFILPGGHKAATHAHICRTVCRRVERSCVQLHNIEPLSFPALPYINRLSDYFFVLSRYINHQMKHPSTVWVAD